MPEDNQPVQPQNFSPSPTDPGSGMGDLPPAPLYSPGAPTPPAPQKPPKFSKKLLVVVAAALLALAVAAGAYFGLVKKTPTATTFGKVYHVGILSALDFFLPTAEGFKQKMAELGYIEGQNIVYDIQKAPTPVGNQNVLKKFVKDKIDLIFVYPTEASLEAKEVTKGTGIPIVSANAFFEGNDLADSIQRPGGNLTGVRFPGPEVALKRFDVLRELAPAAKRYWIPFQKDYPTVAPALEVLKPVAAAAGVTLIEAPFITLDELKSDLNARPAAGDFGLDAILQIAEPLSTMPDYNDVIYKFADARKVPIGGSTLLESDYGPMFEVGLDTTEVGKLAAPLADKIFKGTPPGTIPIITPDIYLQVNYKSIQKLGLTISEGLLGTATKIIR